jgi:hypothetical protein
MELSCSIRTDGRTDGETDLTDMTNLKFAFRHFANAPKNQELYWATHCFKKSRQTGFPHFGCFTRK